MTRLQSITFRLSEIRERLAGTPDMAEDENSALMEEYGRMERERRALMIAQDQTDSDVPQGATDDADTPDADSEDVEYRSLLSRVNVGEYFNSVLEQRQVQGAEAELQEHANVGANQIPLDALREERAVTPAATNVGRNQQMIEPYVFPNMIASHLAVPMPRVASGEPLYPDVATAATVGGPHTDSTKVDETTGSFNTVNIAPARFQASFFYRRSDAARFAGMGAALRQNLNDALADALDKYLITQLAASTTISTNTAPTKKQSYSDILKLFAYSRVDGRWARNTQDLRTVIGTDTYGLLALLSNTLSGNQAVFSALNVLNGIAGGGRIEGATQGVRLSAHIPATKSNLQKSIIRIGTRRDAVFPMWEGVTLITDEVTKAATGEIVITAVLLANFALLRKDGFYLAQTYIA